MGSHDYTNGPKSRGHFLTYMGPGELPIFKPIEGASRLKLQVYL